MNGFLNLGLDLWQLLVLIAAVVAAIVVVRFSVTFDLNRFLDGKQERVGQQIKNACTHVEIELVADRPSIRSLFVSPPGTMIYICQRCGAQTYLTDGEAQASMEYWLKNLDQYFARGKRFRKLLKKSGRT